MWGGNSFDGLGTFLFVGLVAIVLLVALGIFNIYEAFQPKVIKSKTILIPEKRLHTDGKTIDTIYIYKEKK